ncbi:MAG: MerR family transcriptional regulator, partial [Bacilli bacterium]
MLINEVMKITGLTKRAIRFYERKGLLSIQRQGNGYRIYSDEDIIILKKIKLLRSCGISISNIKLLFANIITLEELIEKRKKEIENENGYQISMFANILNIFQEFENGQYDLDMSFDENVDMYPSSDNLALGIDIGTTSISAAVVDIEKKITIDTYTIPNDSNIITSNSNFKEQDPNIIYSKVKKLIELIVSSYSFIKSIGFT